MIFDFNRESFTTTTILWAYCLSSKQYFLKTERLKDIKMGLRLVSHVIDF